MAEAFSKLAQVEPAATTVVDVFAATGETIITAVYIANRSATPTAFRFSHAPLGAVDATIQYHYYDLALAGNETFQFGPLAMVNTDKLRVYVDDATVTVSVHGLEIT